MPICHNPRRRLDREECDIDVICPTTVIWNPLQSNASQPRSAFVMKTASYRNALTTARTRQYFDVGYCIDQSQELPIIVTSIPNQLGLLYNCADYITDECQMNDLIAFTIIKAYIVTYTVGHYRSPALDSGGSSPSV